MAREINIPSTSTFVQDFGLNVTPAPAVRNKKVLIIGTASDGPMYEPILINKPEEAEYIWGDQAGGDLVRGIYECWNVQTGFPTVVGVRIGNGKKAVLELLEASGTGANAPQTASTVSLKLESLYPGQGYNQITIGYNENRQIAIYNPKTGYISTFTVDTEHPNNPNAQVHNVAELVDAINADRNLSSVLTASYEALTADYEFSINSSSSGIVSNSDVKVELNLNEILSNNYVTTSGFMIESPVGSGVTSSNNITELETVEAVSVSEWELIKTNGSNIVELSLSPLDGKGSVRWDTIQCLKDYNNDNQWMTSPSGVIKSEFIYQLSNKFMDGGSGEGFATASGGYNGTNTFNITVPLCLDDSEEVNGNYISSGIIVGNSVYNDYQSDWTLATCQGIQTKLDSAGVSIRPSGQVKVYVSTDSDPNGYWQELPYSKTSGVYLSAYSNGIATFSIGSSLTANVSGVMRKLVDADGTILPNRYLRISANTIKGFLGEVETLPELEDAGTTNFTSYFVRDNEVVFNKVPDFDIIINYGTRINYEVGSNVSLSDAYRGFLSFTNPEMLPGPGGHKLDSKNIFIRLRYKYMPNFPNITSKQKSLSGGTNGNYLSNAERYKTFNIAYDKLKNYNADIYVPMGAYIDATAIKANPVTGLKEEIPVGFHIQLEDFLEDLSINSVQPHAVLGVSPSLKNTQESKDLWVDRLTIPDLSDPNRAANIMTQIQNKFMSIVAFEPLFLNIGRGRPYIANGQAAYAGFLASIPYNISPTNKEIPGISSIRFDLSVNQFERLNAMRYVTMMAYQGRNPTVVEDVTAAPYGSDFVNWSTFSIMAEASNRVRSIAREFLGRPNSVEVRASLEQLISNALRSMDGLRGFDFSITSSASQQVLGTIEIDLVLVPVFTIKRIRNTVKLRKNLTTNT